MKNIILQHKLRLFTYYQVPILALDHWSSHPYRLLYSLQVFFLLNQNDVLDIIQPPFLIKNESRFN